MVVEVSHTPMKTKASISLVPDTVWAVLVGILAILLAELASQQNWVSQIILPAPSTIAATLIEGLSTSMYWRHWGSTFFATIAGFLLASVVAISMAGCMASVDKLERVLTPYIIAAQTLPKIAIAPLVILWLGFGETGKIFIVTITAFFPVLVNSLEGFRLRSREYSELMRSLGASKWQVFWTVRLPGAVPYVFSGLHIGILFALIGSVVAEFVGSRQGLGYLLLEEKALFNVPGVFAILILLMITGLVLHGAMVEIEKRLGLWTGDVKTLTV